MTTGGLVSPGPLAAVAVLALAWATGSATRWWSADRAVARLGGPGMSAGTAPAIVERALRRAAVDVAPALALRLWFAAVALCALTTTFLRGGVVLTAVAVVAPPAAVLAADGRAARRRIRQLPPALDGVAAGLRGGASLRLALADAAQAGGPLAEELGRITDHAAAGVPLARALADWADGADDPDTRLAGAALVVAAELGGPGADAVDAAASSLRERAEATDEITALSVQARLSAVLLTVTPLVFATLLTSLDPTSARFLLGSPAGWACIAVGGLLDLAGGLWMARIVRGAR